MSYYKEKIDIIEIVAALITIGVFVGSSISVIMGIIEPLILIVSAFLISLALLYFLYRFVQKKEYDLVKGEIDRLFGSVQLSHGPRKYINLKDKIKRVCNILGIDKCTIYIQDNSETDLLLFFEHKTQKEYMQGIVRRRETSFQIWVKGEPWYARNPGETKASEKSAFRTREGIVSAMAFPLTNGKIFGTVFFNFTTKKHFFRKAGYLRWIQRWKFRGNHPHKEYKRILQHFVDDLSFHLELQRKLIDSPLSRVRTLSFFKGLYEILSQKDYKDALSRHLLSVLYRHVSQIGCAIYLQEKSETIKSSKPTYKRVDSSGNESLLSMFKKTYILSIGSNTNMAEAFDLNKRYGPFEHVHIMGGGAPLVLTSDDSPVTNRIEHDKLFDFAAIRDGIKPYMILPIYSTSYTEAPSSKDTDCKSRIYNKKQIPKGYIVVVSGSPRSLTRNYMPMTFSQISDLIGLVLSVLEYEDAGEKLARILNRLSAFERSLQNSAESWDQEVAPLLDIVISQFDANKADLWAYRDDRKRFYLVAEKSEEDAFVDVDLTPRPDGNTYKIIETGQNYSWADTSKAQTLNPKANFKSGIQALMGFPIEGIINSLGVIWIRWDKKRNDKDLEENSTLLDVLFQISGYLLTVTSPVNEIQKLVNRIEKGARIVMYPIPTKQLEPINDYEEGVLLIKPPHSSSSSTIETILSRATEVGCEIHGLVAFSGKELSNNDVDGKKIIEQHLGRAYDIAIGQESISKQERTEINRIYNKDLENFRREWQCSPEEMEVIPAMSLGIDPKIITQKWDEGRAQERFHREVYNGLNKIGRGKSVLPVRIPQKDNRSFFLLNGYVPGYVDLYEQEASKTYAVLLRWPKLNQTSPLTWRYLRETVFGDNNNPDECFKTSVRWKAKNDGDAYSIKDPNTVNGQRNVIHFSVSPLEAMKDMYVWFNMKPEDSIFGKMLIQEASKHREIEIDLGHIVSTRYERFIAHHKKEREDLIDKILEISLWSLFFKPGTTSQLVNLWQANSLEKLLSHPERKYILSEFFFWKDILFSRQVNRPNNVKRCSAERIINALQNRYNSIPYVNTELLHIDPEKLNKILDYLYDELDPQPWSMNSISENHFTFVFALNCWVNDQITINKVFISKAGIQEKLQKTLESSILEMATRLMSYTFDKQKTGTPTNGQIKDTNPPILKDNEEYKGDHIFEYDHVTIENEESIGLILAAGRGTRAKSTIAKGMLHIDHNTTAIQLTIKYLKDSGINHIFVAVQQQAKGFIQYLRNLDGEYGNIHIIKMGACKGVGFRIAVIMKLHEQIKAFRGHVVIAYSDMPFVSHEKVTELLRASRTSSMAIGQTKKKKLSGQIILDENQHIKSIMQSRFDPKIVAEYQDAGIYAFRNEPTILNCLEDIEPDVRGDYIFGDIVSILYDQNKVITSCTIDSKETIGIDTPSDLLLAHIKRFSEYSENELEAQISFFEERGDKFIRDHAPNKEKQRYLIKEYHNKIKRYTGPANLFSISLE